MKLQTALGQFGSVGDLALELRKALTAIAAGWNVEHHPDGTHGDITADTITGGTITAEPGGNVALTDAANTFTQIQTLSGTSPGLQLVETDAPANQKRWIVGVDAQNFLINTVSDSLVSTQHSAFHRDGSVHLGLVPFFEVDGSAHVATVRASGAVYERARSVAMGEWTDFTPTLTASAGTVTINTIHGCRYTLIGQTMILTFYLAITVSATPNSLNFTLPGGATSASVTANAMLDKTGTAVMFQTIVGTTTATLYRDTAGTGNWTAGTNTIAGTATFPIQ